VLESWSDLVFDWLVVMHGYLY